MRSFLPESLRITPAGAGKTSRNSKKRTTGRDHPRRCGENSGIGILGLFIDGSPPQVRGKLPHYLHFQPHHRITPAGAGKTFKSFIVGCDTKDHPRRCGENASGSRAAAVPYGSPPQVRGKRDNLHFGRGHIRITPAGAGKTTAEVWNEHSKKDHPRRCGENLRAKSKATRGQGSPPQVRGKRACLSVFTLSKRITPAGAGKTQ